MPKRQLVKVGKQRLRGCIATYVYAMDVLTVDELREECVEVERSFGRRGRAAYLQQRKGQRGAHTQRSRRAAKLGSRRATWASPKSIQARLLELQAGQSEGGRDTPRLESREVVPREEDENKNVYSQSNRHKYLLRYLPEDERLRCYMEARNRTFAEHHLSGMCLVSGIVQKARERFRVRR